MTPRTLVLFAFAGAAAAATVALAQSWLSAERAALLAGARTAPQAAAPGPRLKRVLVAAADLPAGTLIQPKHLRWQPWPEESLAAAYLAEGAATIDDFAGAVARARLAAGQPVSDGLIVRPGDRGFLAAVLAPGMRAVTVPVNATTGIAGFVFPGDRVDLILTHALAEGAGGRRHAAETVLGDVRVIAVDQKVDDPQGQARVAKTATLELTPKQAEVVAMLTDLGRLTLSLRSLARPEGAAAGDPAEAPSYTLDSEVSALLSRPRAAPEARRVSVLRGGKAEETSFAGGGTK